MKGALTGTGTGTGKGDPGDSCAQTSKVVAPDWSKSEGSGRKLKFITILMSLKVLRDYTTNEVLLVGLMKHG